MEFPIHIAVLPAFISACLILAFIPGPVVTLVVGNSLRQGTRAGATVVLGSILGNTLLLAAGTLGLAWVLKTLAPWFELLRLLGAAYLVFLGIKLWLAPAEDANGEASRQLRRHSLFWQGFLVAATNPKSLLFYLAFFPQFMDPALPSFAQLATLSVIFLLVVTPVDLSYAVLAGRLRPFLGGGRRGRLRNKLTGTVFIATAAAMALMHRV